MIRDVGEDPLSPALRDIERERGREGEGGREREGERGRERKARTALDTRWSRLLCVVCWCRGEAPKVKNFLYD